MTNPASASDTFILGGDMRVNRLGFGAMRITGKGIWGPPENKEEALKVLKRAIELGVNFIDTADSYGPHVSEALIAEALCPYPEGLIIATKGGLTRTGPDQWPVNAHPDHLRQALNGSLRRLRLSRIDLYQLHRIDPKVPARASFLFLQEAQKEHKIRHIGLSEVGVDEIKRAQEYFEVVSVQNKYSVDNRTWEPVLEYCEANNIAFIPWFPLAAGKVDAVEKLKAVAATHNATVHQIALAWLLHHSDHILLIPGTSNAAHLEENMAASAITLSSGDMEILDGISPGY